MDVKTASPAVPGLSATTFYESTGVNVNDSRLVNSGRDTTYNVQINYNIGVFTDVISFIKSIVQYLVAWARRTNGREPDPVEISSIMQRLGDPSSMPINSIADRYARSMLECMVGYPLYEPEPFSEFSKEYLRKGVSVGDVGLIREDGTFDFLFNICPAKHGSLNPPNLPDGFSLRPEHSKTRTMRPLPPDACFFPPTVTKTESGKYICKRPEGAVLMLPKGAIQDEAINTGRFEELAKRRGVEWYEYTKFRGRSISNGSLYLVTSFTKCTEWGIAFFDRPCDPGQALTFVSNPLGWKGLGAFTTKVTNPNKGGSPNQCVFLRGYKIMIRQDIFDTLPTRQRAQRIRGGGGADLLSRVLPGGNPLTRKMSNTKKSDKAALTPNFNSPPVHPSDLINAELLSQNPNAKVALTHDDVWCDLLQNNFPTLSSAGLVDITRSYTSTVDENGCVSLEKISGSSNVQRERNHLLQGTEAPALHKPIRNARNERNPGILMALAEDNYSVLSPTETSPASDHTPLSFGETFSPVTAIQAVLRDYPFSASILREFLQNSDNAGATKQIFILDKVNAALIGYNDSEFLEQDWQAIQHSHISPKADTSRISKYGVGSKAYYHITDRPQILSGSFFAVLDPLNPKITRVEYDRFKTTENRKHFNFFSNVFKRNFFLGTAIRLPLRSSRSDLSQRVIRIDELQQMISDYISEELNVSLLFLDKLRTIEIWQTGNGFSTRLAKWTKAEPSPVRHDHSLRLVTDDIVLSDGDTEYSWRIVRTQSTENEAIVHLSQLAGSDSANYIIKRHKLRFDVRIAYPLTSRERISGRLFTFLPLPPKTGFPIHIHALFFMTSSRQRLRKPNEKGIVQGSDKDALIKWNRLLFDHSIPQGWSHLLKTLAEDASCGDIFDAWPPQCSSITSGDGVYWQDILSNTFKVVVGSRLKVWPTVTAQRTTTYIDLESSLIIAQGQVDANVLAVLAELGLICVQLPQSLLDLVDDSMTKLSPSAAHGRLQGAGAFDWLGQLSADKRALVCAYLLSDNDISNIFGLPVIPVLNGSSVALDDRNKSLQRYIALTKDEAEVFRGFAYDAIPLDQLGPEMARLIREQAISQVNVDLLGPQTVIDYLSSGRRFLSDEWLIEFWCWLLEWHLRMDLFNILENSALKLIPTTKGPRPISFPIFNALDETGNIQLFEKLGLAFVTSALPAFVIHFLLNHNILRNPNDLNQLLTAINPASVPSMTDVEAESIFRLATSYPGSIPADNLEKLRKLRIFPILVPTSTLLLPPSSNSSVSWRSIDGINVKGISPIQLIPLANDVHFLSGPSIEYSSLSLLKQLNILVLKEGDILLRALSHFTSQPKPLQVAFISYIRTYQYRLPIVTLTLRRTTFLRTTDGSLQSPEKVIDPKSPLASLFTKGCKDSRVPMNEDVLDQQLLGYLRALGLTKSKLDAYLVQERITYISSNSSSPKATAIARSLLTLMNEPNFPCLGLFVDPNMRWLPTASGLTTSKKCINSGRRDTDLFDQVLVMLDGSISISPPFKALLDWDKPLPLEVLTEQLHHTLELPVLEVQSQKICSIVRELAGRQLRDTDIQDIQTTISGRPWVPTKSGRLAQHSRAVFVSVDIASGFHEVAFSKTEKEIYLFLCRMGCLGKPTAAGIIEELERLQKQSNAGGTFVQHAILLLDMLPDSITEEEYQSILVPDQSGCLVPLSTGIYFNNRLRRGRSNVNERETPVAHHLVTEGLAKKLRMNRLGR